MPPFRNRCLDRRTFLRGAGAALALPWLDAMVPARAGNWPAPPLRSLFVFAPNGMKMDEWTPAATGKGFALPFLLEPLAPVRERVCVFTGLAIDGGRPHGDGPGDHARAASSFLTCAHPRKTGGADIHVGESIDQAIAAQTGGATSFASLELGMEAGAAAGICDSGYSCAYSSHVSWRTPTTPVAKETEPRAVFTRLFGDPQQALDVAERGRQRRRTDAVLDEVLAEAKALAQRVGPADRQKLDEYLTAVRELEQQLQKREQEAVAPAVPAGLFDAQQYPGKLDLMYELIALAFAADLTRTVTFMLGNAGSNRSYRFVDVPNGHHEVSHHGGKPEKLAAIRRINRFHVERFAAFLGRLAARKEGGTDLLRQSLIVFGSGIGDGNRHNHDDLPVLLAGLGGGAVAGGRHVRFEQETPMANLYLAVAQAAGASLERFADSTGAHALK